MQMKSIDLTLTNLTLDGADCAVHFNFKRDVCSTRDSMLICQEYVEPPFGLFGVPRRASEAKVVGVVGGVLVNRGQTVRRAPNS